LDDVFALRVTALSAILKILEAMVLKNFFDDFGDRFLLENLAIGGAREEPEPRNNFSTVMGKAVVATYGSEAAYKAIPMTKVIAGVVDLEGHLLADNVLEGNGMIFGKEIGGEMKELRHTFVAAEAKKKERVLAKRGLDSDETFLLGVGHIQNAPFLLEQGGDRGAG
jgi:hypothetical protein